MQRVGFLYEKVYSFENLYIAYKKSIKGTKNRESKEWGFNYERNILKLKKELKEESYIPNKYRYFILDDPKKREISVASFRDRVVHHAIINILEPIYEKSFIFDSYATRKKKGTHKAVKRCQSFIKDNHFYLKCDIRKFFDNIEHKKLMEIIRRKIKDEQLNRLIEKVIQNSKTKGKGLPIGNLTSQFFANVYLNSFDHYIKERLNRKYYLRYMDDFVILSKDKCDLKKLKKDIGIYLEVNYNLELKEKATFLNKIDNGIPFLGVKIFRGTIRIRRESLDLIIAKLKNKKWKYETGQLDEESYVNSLHSIFVHLKNYNTYNLRKNIISKYLGDY